MVAVGWGSDEKINQIKMIKRLPGCCRVGFCCGLWVNET
jgi:hypothetical protein